MVFLIKQVCSNLLMGGGRNLVSLNSCRVKIAPSVAVGISEHKVTIASKKSPITGHLPLGRAFIGGGAEDVFIRCC